MFPVSRDDELAHRPAIYPIRAVIRKLVSRDNKQHIFERRGWKTDSFPLERDAYDTLNVITVVVFSPDNAITDLIIYLGSYKIAVFSMARNLISHIVRVVKSALQSARNEARGHRRNIVVGERPARNIGT